MKIKATSLKSKKTPQKKEIESRLDISRNQWVGAKPMICRQKLREVLVVGIGHKALSTTRSAENSLQSWPE